MLFFFFSQLQYFSNTFVFPLCAHKRKAADMQEVIQQNCYYSRR